MTSSDQVGRALGEWSERFMRSQMLGFMRFVRQSGFSMSQIRVLFALHGHRESRGVSDLGDHLGVSSAAASQLLDRLVQQGLILRSEDPEDRRTKRIELTDKGQTLVDTAMKGRERWFIGLAETMTEPERAAVLAGLEVLIRKLKESGPEEVPFDPVEAKENAQL